MANCLMLIRVMTQAVFHVVLCIDPILNDFQNSFPDAKCFYHFSEINKRGIGGHNASGRLPKLINTIYIFRGMSRA